MNPRIHAAETVEDAVNMLDTRIPLLYREIQQVAQSLYDSAFREGARQGRLAGVEGIHNRIKKMAEHSQPNTIVSQQSFLRQLISVLDPEGTADTQQAVREYEEPTDTIRKRLEEKQRQLKDRAEFAHVPLDGFNGD